MREKSCRLCKSTELYTILDLGYTPISDQILTLDQLEQPETSYPITLNSCNKCGFCQLGYVVPPELMYNENYSYDGSATTTLQNHHISMANQICERFKLKEKSLVMDIGSNAGVLLSGFRDKGMKVLGIDPSINVANIARKKGIDVIGEFFSSKLAKKIREEHEEVSVITGTNVFAHIDDLDDFFKAADIVLSNDGIIVIEAPYLITLLDDLEYDTIYHEHLSYISVKPLKEFCKKMNMDIFNAELNDIHGGSLRLFIGRKDVREISKNIETLLNLEEEKGIYKKERLEKFSNDVKQQKKELNMLLWNLKKEGKKIVGISAPAKGNALTNYCLLYTSPSPRDLSTSRMPSSA